MLNRTVISLLIAVLSSCGKVRADNSFKQTLGNSIDTITTMSAFDYLDASEFKLDDSLLCTKFPESAIKSPMVEPTRMNFSHALQYYYTPNSSTGPYFLIIVKQSIYNSLSSDIKTYAEDVHTVYGYGICVETVTDDTPEDIRSLIQYYQEDLCGVLLVGDISCAIYEIENDHNQYGYRHWPCDLFFMDLDGTWADSDSNGRYDSHTGNVAPEIFLGRLSAYGLSSYGNEVDLIRRQLQKSHKYWWKASFHAQQTTLNYICNVDWKHSFPADTIKKVFSTHNITDVRCEVDSCFSASDYLSKISSNIYGFTHLAAHSEPTALYFNIDSNTEEVIHNYDIKNINSSNYAYSLYCCSACNWKLGNTNGYIGGAYLFNNGKTITVLGTTKTGGMRSTKIKYFYPHLVSSSLGEAFVNWWNHFGNSHSHSCISWYYGMTILGDPTIDFRYQVSDHCANNLCLTSYPNNNTSNLVMFKAGNKITVSNSFIIPQGVHVIFDAPQVVIEDYFSCPVGASFEIRSEGCEL